MASPEIAWIPLLLLISLALHESISLSDPSQSVEVGFLWENPRVGENHHTGQVVIDTNKLKSLLRLVCFINPPLPTSSEYKKNEIVKWERFVGNKRKAIKGLRYWDDGLTTVGISLDHPSFDVIGSYVCSYGQSSKSISVKVADLEMIKLLKLPSNFSEVITYATHIQDGSGITGWSKDSFLDETKGNSLNCKKHISKSRPKSIHEILPSDIQVISAVGDGFTVSIVSGGPTTKHTVHILSLRLVTFPYSLYKSGFGARATSWNGFFEQYRGISWSIGGDDYLNTTTTLPNIIKEFNPELKGFSTKKERLDLNKANWECSSECLEGQVNEVIAAMKNEKTIDFQNDWKLLTVWTGMVDLCHICQAPEKYESSKFIKKVMQALKTLKKEVPRLYVNLVPPMDVSVLTELFTKKSSCQILKQTSCPCVSANHNETIQAVSNTAKEYFNLLVKLVNSGIYDVGDQFTVVLQPFMFHGPRDKDGKLAVDLFGQDCLHFNSKGHKSAAVALWNSMVMPETTKAKEWYIDKDLVCPTRVYITTKENDNLVTSDDDDKGSMPPGAAITLSVILTITVVGVTIFVWRSKKSRTRNDTLRLLSTPYRPRI